MKKERGAGSWRTKKKMIPMFERGIATKNHKSLECVEKAACDLLRQYGLYSNSTKVRCTAVLVVQAENDEYLATCDEVLHSLLANVTAPKLKVVIGMVDSVHASREEGAASAQKEGKVGKYTGPKAWLSNYKEKLNGEFDDYWRGFMHIVCTKRAFCYYCGEIVVQHKNRPYDTKPVLTHLERHAASIAKSTQQRGVAAQGVGVAGLPMPTEVAVLEELPDEWKRAPTNQEKDRAIACIAKCWDVQNPFKNGNKPEAYNKDLIPVILMGANRQEKRMKKEIQAKAAAVRSQRLAAQRARAAQRRLDAEEEKLKMEEKKAAAEAKTAAEVAEAVKTAAAKATTKPPVKVTATSAAVAKTAPKPSMEESRKRKAAGKVEDPKRPKT